MAFQLEGLDEALNRYMRNLSENLAWIRERRGITVVNLATLAGTGPKTWYNVIQGTHAPDVRTLVGLAEVLDVDVADLFLPVSEFRTIYKEASATSFRLVRADGARRNARRARARQNTHAKRTLPSTMVDLHHRRPA